MATTTTNNTLTSGQKSDLLSLGISSLCDGISTYSTNKTSSSIATTQANAQVKTAELNALASQATANASVLVSQNNAIASQTLANANSQNSATDTSSRKTISLVVVLVLFFAGIVYVIKTSK